MIPGETVGFPMTYEKNKNNNQEYFDSYEENLDTCCERSFNLLLILQIDLYFLNNRYLSYEVKFSKYKNKPSLTIAEFAMYLQSNQHLLVQGRQWKHQSNL